jgi:hypothetical protein
MRLALYICLTGLALGIERVEGDARFVPFARSREDAQQHYVQGKNSRPILTTYIPGRVTTTRRRRSQLLPEQKFFGSVTVDAKAKTFSAYMGDVAKLLCTNRRGVSAIGRPRMLSVARLAPAQATDSRYSLWPHRHNTWIDRRH